MPTERPDQAQGGEDGEAADRGGAPGERLLEEHREEFDELASRLLHRVGIAGDEVREVVGRRRMGEEEAAAAKKKKEKKSNLSVLHNPRGHQAALLGAELPGDKAERERLLVLLAPP